MIEVEKAFQPTKEELARLLEGAELFGEVHLHDRYFDFPDLRYLKAHVYLRERNGGYELKVNKSDGVRLEIEDEEGIRNYLGIKESLQDFIDAYLEVVIDIKNRRNVYKKEGFTIDVDSMDFGYELIEIELMISDESQASEAREKILTFAKRHGIEHKKIPAKREEYFRLKKPEIYRELYG